MKKLLSIISFGLLSCGNSVRIDPLTVPAQDPSAKADPAMSFYSLSAIDISGNPYSFDQLKGKKVMVVNTASECGYTPQYKQLEELYETYKDKGFVIVGFPSNDFGGQEPGSETEIAGFCQKNYGVTFPMMSKVSTKGNSKHPVYQWLTEKAQNGWMDSQVKWNFGKYLINEDGTIHTVLASSAEPLSEPVLVWLDGKK
ncbi:MAG: glutathione peroxidase [Flavobacteriales bacterium]|nr:glutathione peroxidase [Flavobacteriales bacterium]